jgi:hypothetical protein
MVMLRSYISLLVGIVGNMSIIDTPLQSREIPIVLKKHVVFNFYLEILELKWRFISEKIIELNAGPATFWYITLNPD